jgi:hypothetical protein
MDLGLTNAAAVVVGGSRGMASPGASVIRRGCPGHLPGGIGPVPASLASRRNSSVSGADINVDGGQEFT